MLKYQFENPEFLWLLLVVPLLALWYWLKRKQRMPEIRFPEAGFLAHGAGNWLARLWFLMPLLRIVAVALAIAGGLALVLALHLSMRPSYDRAMQ